jgi:tRNA modification GTPase
MSLYDDSTIVAVATPSGFGGIGVIRLSGKNSLDLIQKILNTSIPFSPNHVSFHHLIHPETKLTIDDVLITYFKAPHSFTGEDIIEISCHGSPVVLSEVLQLLISFGAQLAQGGEFSMRAFLNQRMDLTQAEAINDLIHAQTSYQAQIAARQLRGELSKQIKPIKDALIEMIVHFESSVEFVEDDLDALDIERFIHKLDKLIASINQLISSYRLGRLIRSGIKLALIGRPNVGKSSVFNSLLGKDRAIVTHIPGTTRDTLTEVFSINGIPVELIDTAGIRETEDFVEKLGVERTNSAIADADFVIAIIEANQIPSPDEITFLAQLPINLLVINKCDLGFELSEELTQKIINEKPVSKVSALTGQGINELRESIHSALTSGTQIFNEGGIVTNERHFHALEQSLNAMRQAQQNLTAGLTEEIVLVNLHEALKSLGVVTGETLIGDIINQIFSTFCIGK